MTPSLTSVSFPYSIFQNGNAVQFRVIYYNKSELLMFPSNMFFAQELAVNEYNSGKLLYSGIIPVITELNGEEVIEYSEKGNWKKINNSESYEFCFFGEGIFLVDLEEYTAIFREMQSDNPLESMAIQAIKSQKPRETTRFIKKHFFFK
jgi:hypothetical protein